MTPSWLHSIVTIDGVRYVLRFRKGDLFVADRVDGGGVRAIVMDRLRSYAENPAEVIPPPNPRRRERPLEKAPPKCCPTCGRPT